MAERKTVTLFIYIPDKNQVILSRRGKLEKKAGLLQASVHGQIEPGEISQLAMKREFAEELKGDFHQLTNIRDYGDAKVGTANPEHTYYHAASMDSSLIETLQPTQEVSEFILVSEEDLPKIKKYSDIGKKQDYTEDGMVMFDDELDVLKKIFKDYSKM